MVDTGILFHSWATAKKYRDKMGVWRVTVIGDHIEKREYESSDPYNDILRDVTEFIHHKFHQPSETFPQSETII